jgi:hypothetical protein
MSASATAVWNNTKFRLREIANYLPLFLKAPVTNIQRAPNWDVWNALLLLLLVTIPSGVLGGAIARNFMNILWGIFLLPLVTVFFTATISFGFYYVFVTLFKSKTDPTKVFVIVVLAAVPLLIIRIFVPLLPPLSVLGVACSATLLTVGFVENFGLPKQKVIKLISGLFAVFLMFWVYQMIQASKQKSKFNQEIPAETLQLLEKEFE